MSTKETKGVRCPFCGAPYRRLVPSNVLQLKCDYCGAMYRTPPRIGIEIPQCANHPDRFAVGICDDCGRNFCSDCLEVYDFKTRDGTATLHLCPECHYKRDADKADTYVLGGILLAFVGFLFAILSWPLGAFIIAIGVVEIVYGAKQRPQEVEVGKAEVPEEEEKIAPPEPELGEADIMYDELLSRYIEHWGLPTGPELLDNEIRAYTWHGDSYGEAIAKVYKRQHKKR